MTDQRQFAAVGFHSGELEAQRHAGVQTQAARLARMVGPAELRPGITAILADTTFAAITARDRTGRLWTSPLLGAPGFLHASGPRTLQINTLVPSADPLHSPRTGQPAGVIAIDFTPYIETDVFDVLEARVNGGAQTFADLPAVEAYLAARYPNIPAPAIKIRAESGYAPAEGGLRPLAAPEAMAQTAEGLRADLTQTYRDLRWPVLVVRGAISKLVSAEALEKTQALRPDLPVVVVPGADHYVNEVSPDITAQAITNFIDA